MPVYSETDLQSSGFGSDWGQQRTWTALPNSSVNGNGWGNAELPYLAMSDKSGHTQGYYIAVIQGGITSQTFNTDLATTTGSVRPFYNTGASLSYDSTAHTFTYKDSNGGIWTFNDLKRSGANLDTTAQPTIDYTQKYGQLLGYTDKAGTQVQVSYFTSGTYNGQVQYVTRSNPADSASVERFEYAYQTLTNYAGSSAPLLSSVTLERKNAAGTYVAVRDAEYTYYTGYIGATSTLDPNGRFGDLKLVTLKDFQHNTSGDIFNQSYYRYYKLTGTSYDNSFRTPGPTNDRQWDGTQYVDKTGGVIDTVASSTPGYADYFLKDVDVYSALKSVTTGASFARLAANYPSYESATDAQVKTYANYTWRYERWADYNTNVNNWSPSYQTGTRYRAIEETAQSGCSTCSGGIGSSRYDYAINPNGTDRGISQINYNTWRMETTDFLPDETNADNNGDGVIDAYEWADNDRTLTFTNEVGQVMLQDVISTGHSSKYITSITSSGTTATATLAGHGYSVGDVLIVSAADQAAYDGVITVTGVTANTFTYTMTSSPGVAATGAGLRVQKAAASYTQSGATLTLTMSNHGFANGDRVALAGATSQYDTQNIHGAANNIYSGVYTVSNVTANTFDVTSPYDPGFSPTGTIVANKVTKEYRTYYRYQDRKGGSGADQDTGGQLVLEAHPNAVTGFDVGYTDLVGFSSGTSYAYLTSASGEVETWTYGTSTSGTISETLAGDVAGYLKAHYVLNGTSDASPSLMMSQDYVQRSINAGTMSVFFVAHQYRDKNDVGTIDETTTHTYSWYNGTTQAKSETVEQPIVSTTENGPGGTVGVKTDYVYDLYGRLTWTRDADGHITYTQYDPSTGGIVETITDVDTDITSDFANLPAGWTNSSGLHLKTVMTLDGLGRVTKSIVYTGINPNGNVSYTVYNDGVHEVRSYRGIVAQGNQWLLTAPVVIAREYWPSSGAPAGQRTAYRETLTLAPSAVVFDQRTPTSITRNGSTATVTLSNHGFAVGDQFITSGATQTEYNGTFTVTGVTSTTFTYTITGTPASPATGTILVNLGRPTGTDTISPSTIQAMARQLYNNAGQLVEGDNYTSLSGISSYSQAAATLGAIGVNYLATKTDYDSRGRIKRMQSPDGTITRMDYDVRGLVMDVWKGTDDQATAGYWSPTNQGGTNLVKFNSFDYDANGNQTLSRQVLAQDSTTGNDSTYYSTQSVYDFRDRLTDSRGPDNVATHLVYDNLDEITETDIYADANTNFVIDSGELRGKTTSAFDERGQMYRSTVYNVTPSTGTSPGTVGDGLTTNFWYDARGNLVKTRQANGLQSKSTYDGAGRQTATYLSTDAAETSYADALSATNDHLIEQTATYYDKAGRDVLDTTLKRKNDTPSSGLLTSENSWSQSNVNWYDAADRLIESTNYGSEYRADYDSSGNLLTTLPTRVVYARTTGALIDGDADKIPDVAEGTPPAPPTSANETNYSFIVAQYKYDAAGRLYQVIDNKSRTTQTSFDLAGRKTAVIENYIDGTVAATDTDKDRTTSYVYDAQGRLSQIIATNANGTAVTSQPTTFLYNSPIDQSWNTQTVYPDSTVISGGTDQSVSALTQSNGIATATSAAHGYAVGDVVRISGVTNDARFNAWVTVTGVTTNTFTFVAPADLPATASGTILARKLTGSDLTAVSYDRLGRQSTSSDQRGVVHTFTYDAAGRLGTDSIGTGTLPANVDGLVRTIAYGYDDLSRQNVVTSKDVSGSILNQVATTFDGWGNVIKSQQSHSGAVTGTTPSVQYSYVDGATGGVAKYVRLDTMTYPNGRVLQYNYNTAGSDDDALSRLNILHDNTAAVDLVDYNYVGAWGTAGEELHPGVSNGLTLTVGYGGNKMLGWDRFGRIIKFQWRNGTGASQELDRFDYIYDRAGNRVNTDRFVDGTTTDDSYSESYAYDGLDRLTDYRRGIQSSGSVPTSGSNLQFRQQWTLDALGNWTSFVVDADGGGAGAALTQTRTANAANEIQSVTGNSPAWTTPAYDTAGDMTTLPKGMGNESTPVYFVYDGWGRVAGISSTATPDGDFTDAGEVRYSYDGMGRRIGKTFATGSSFANEDSLYDENYQIVETRHNGSSNAYEQFVWDQRYIDAPIVRYRDANGGSTGDGTLEETLYTTFDANYDVTGLVQANEVFVERYVYTPYGDRTVLTGTLGARGSTSYDFWLGHQGLKIDPESLIYYNRARPYSSDLGIEGQRDPYGSLYVDTMNLYEIEYSDPSAFVDPFGTDGIGHGVIVPRNALPSYFPGMAAVQGKTNTPMQRGIEGGFPKTETLPNWQNPGWGLYGSLLGNITGLVTAGSSSTSPSASTCSDCQAYVEAIIKGLKSKEDHDLANLIPKHKYNGIEFRGFFGANMATTHPPGVSGFNPLLIQGGQNLDVYAHVGSAILLAMSNRPDLAISLWQDAEAKDWDEYRGPNTAKMRLQHYAEWADDMVGYKAGQLGRGFRTGQISEAELRRRLLRMLCVK